MILVHVAINEASTNLQRALGFEVAVVDVVVVRTGHKINFIQLYEA
jgi:hypothetical protein